MKEIPIKVIVDGGNCNSHCPFKNENHCLLFNEDLFEAELPPGHVWQDQPQYERHWRCIQF